MSSQLCNILMWELPKCSLLSLIFNIDKGFTSPLYYLLVLLERRILASKTHARHQNSLLTPKRTSVSCSRSCANSATCWRRWLDLPALALLTPTPLRCTRTFDWRGRYWLGPRAAGGADVAGPELATAVAAPRSPEKALLPPTAGAAEAAPMRPTLLARRPLLMATDPGCARWLRCMDSPKAA